MRCNSAISKEHLTNVAELERYTNRVAYDVAEDADMLELPVPTDLREKYDTFTAP